MTDLLASDFKNPALGGPKEKKKDFMKKIKFKIKMKSSKKNIFNPEETRLSPRMCVKLVNVHNLGTVFSRLKPGPVDPLVKDDTPFSSKDALFDMSDRIMFKLTICNGSDLRVMRPWVTRISVRVSDSLGKLVGISEPKVQNSVMNWNDSIFGVAPASSVTLKFLFDVMQQVQETKKEYLFASGKAEFGLFDGEQDVAISSYGSIKVSLEIISTFTKDFSETIVKKQVQASKNRLISLIVEQVN